MEHRRSTARHGHPPCFIHENPVIVSGANDLTACTVQCHGSSPQHCAPWSSATSGEIPPSGQDDRDVCGDTRCRGTSLCSIREKPCLPVKSHVIVREANDLTACAVQRHGSSPQHGAPQDALPCSEIPPGACPELRRRGQDDSGCSLYSDHENPCKTMS
jgi:uncharacterized Zn-binding protein involved in type VI secretion